MILSRKNIKWIPYSLLFCLEESWKGKMETITFFSTGRGQWVWQMAITAPVLRSSRNSYCMELLSLRVDAPAC